MAHRHAGGSVRAGSKHPGEHYHQSTLSEGEVNVGTYAGGGSAGAPDQNDRAHLPERRCELSVAPSTKAFAPVCHWCPNYKWNTVRIVEATSFHDEIIECAACTQAAKRKGRCAHGRPKRGVCSLCPARVPHERVVNNRHLTQLDNDPVFQNMAGRYRELVAEGDELLQTRIGLRITAIEVELVQLRESMDAYMKRKQ